MERSGAELLIVHRDLAAEAAGAAVRRWTAGDEDGQWRAAAGARSRRLPAVDRDSPALILFTSGSTDRPKGVTHTHASMNHTVATQIEVQELGPGDVNLITLATCHIAGLFGQLLPTLRAGGLCILHPRYEPVLAAREIEQSGVTRIQLLPAQLAGLLDAAQAERCDLRSLRCALVGGDVLALDVHRRFGEFTGLEATEVCGMTECFDYSMNPPFGDKRLGSIGRPPPGTQLRLSAATGQEPPPGDPGEILVRSPGVMMGYWQDPERTAEALQRGWLHTGDIARRDRDGWFWFVARSKDSDHPRRIEHRAGRSRGRPARARRGSRGSGGRCSRSRARPAGSGMGSAAPGCNSLADGACRVRARAHRGLQGTRVDSDRTSAACHAARQAGPPPVATARRRACSRRAASFPGLAGSSVPPPSAVRHPLRPAGRPGADAAEPAGQPSGVMPRRIRSKIAAHSRRAAGGSSARAT